MQHIISFSFKALATALRSGEVSEADLRRVIHYLDFWQEAKEQESSGGLECLLMDACYEDRLREVPKTSDAPAAFIAFFEKATGHTAIVTEELISLRRQRCASPGDIAKYLESLPESFIKIIR